MEVGQVWGLVIFVAVGSTIVGALFHSWLSKRAKEVEAAVTKTTDSTSAKINEIRKDL